MTDPTARSLIQRLVDALKTECNWIDNPTHDELIAEALVHLDQPVGQLSTKAPTPTHDLVY